jgi:thiamine-monophosphate kinase
MSSEREILARVRRRALESGPAIALGIGDDCAIYRPRGGEELLFTTDFLIEDIHFTRSTHAPRDIGYKALARGLSDLAAMGAKPRFCLFSLAVPEWADAQYIDGIYRGLLALSASEACPLVGGDLGRASAVTCDVVACGSAPRGKALRRSGARPGDSIWVSGRLGGSALGLETHSGRAWRKHLHPEPRLALGLFLRNKATASMDLSDGLSSDLARLCMESGVAAGIEAPPLFPGATLHQGLHGGEDYELLFTTGPRARIPASHGGVELTRIGQMVTGHPGEVRLAGKLLEPSGYDHFRKR